MAKYLRGAGIDTLELLLTRTDGVTAAQLGKLRGVSTPSARKTLQRAERMKLIKSEPASDCGNAMNTLLYTLTPLGRDVAEGAMDVCDSSDESDDDALDAFPRQDIAPIIANAMRTQPTSVFDMARFV